MKKLQQKHLYGNCVMLSPAGETLCLCDQKKINWYLSRNLAILIKDDPPTIQLNFVPAGNGKADYPYYTAEKKNHCVCCASVVDLTKHHCVPRCFRRFFSKAYKSHNCHDIVLLCDVCHIKYEAVAQQLKLKLIDQYQIERYNKTEEHEALRYLASDANALLRYSDKMPLARREELSLKIKKSLQRDFTIDDLKEICRRDRKLNRSVSEGDRYGAKVVEKLDDIPEFIKMWRKHFVDTMSPKFLPEFWSVSHKDLEY